MRGVRAFVPPLQEALGPVGFRRLREMVDVVATPVGSIKTVRLAAPRLALTFDDGPDPRWTPPLLELLAERGVQATFFLLTMRTRRHPSIVADLVAAGHEIALHGDDHTRLTTLPVREVSRRIRGARAELEDTSGVGVRWFRPPFGAQSLATYAATRLAGLDVVVWGPHAEDWVDGTVEQVTSRALTKVRAEDILLLHDGLEVPTGEAAPTFDRTAVFRRLLDGLAVQGLEPDALGPLAEVGRIRRTVWYRP
jgi:peptidoglycan/xylan/chitin deacetylase (PgdA/CDA1 family)